MRRDTVVASAYNVCSERLSADLFMLACVRDCPTTLALWGRLLSARVDEYLDSKGAREKA